MSPSVAGVAESVLYAGDLPAARRFYEGVLGLAVAHTTERAVVFAVADGQVLIVFAYEAAAEERRTAGGTIPAVLQGAEVRPHKSHLALRVPRAELASWRSHLARHGVDIESEVTWNEHAESLYFRDPAGNLLELVTPGLWER